MKILVIDVAAESFGALSVLNELYNHALQRTEIEWVFVLSSAYLEERGNIRILVEESPKKGWVARLLWEMTCVHKIVESNVPDYVISLQNIMAFRCKKYKQMLYMHMAIPFQKEKKFSFFIGKERIYAVYQYIIAKLIRHSIREADLVVVQGEWLKKEILKKVDCPAEKICVCPTEISVPVGKTAACEQGSPVAAKGFFYPAAPSLFKNHKCVVQAVKILARKGYHDFSVSFTFLNEGRFPETPEIRYLGRIERDSVFEMLSENVLLFPSYMESFGIPLWEARAVGSVILASDCAFSRETLAGYPNAYFFDPFSPTELAEKMIELMNGTHEYQKQEFCFPAHATWETIINRLLVL